MSTHTFPASEVTFPVTTLADAEHVDACVNLRPDPRGGLAAVGVPRATVSLPGAVPLQGGSCTFADGTTLIIVLHEGALKAVAPDGSISVIVDAESLTDTPECILPADGDIVVMFSSSRPARYSCAPSKKAGGALSWSQTDLFPDLAPLMFTRSEMGRVAVDIPEFSLSSSYTTTSQSLSDEDAAKVDKIMRDAYIRLCDKAQLRGWFIQPVFARYRLIGRDGRIIYTSAPVIVAPDSGMQGITADLTFTGEGFRRMEYSRLRANAFYPSFTLTRQPDYLWQRLVRSVEVEVTPQLHPYSATLPGTVSRVSSTATQLVMSATLPGVSPDEPFGAPGTRAAAAVTAILDHTEQAFYPMEALSKSTFEEMARLDRILALVRADSEPVSDLEANLAVPNSFTATSVSRSGDMIVWGGLKTIPFDGYTLPELGILADRVYSPTPTVAQVFMRDGSSVVRSVVSVDRRVTALSPLIVYPSPDAESIMLQSGRQAITLPLTPSPCRRFAYYLNPDLKPVPFNEEREGFAVPSAAPAIREYPSALVAATSDDPLSPCAVSCGDNSAVRSIQAAVRRSNSLTSPTSLFYVFTAAGISTLSLSDSRHRIRLTALDRRSIPSPGAVTPIPGGVAALAGGALITISGSGSRCDTLLDRCDAATLGWSDRFGELWCIPSPSPSGTPVTVISTDGCIRYTREGIDVSGVYSDGAVMRVFTPAGAILDPSVETDAPVTVRHDSNLRHDCRQNAEVTVRVGLLGENLGATLAIRASGGAPARASVGLREYEVSSGDLNHSTDMKMRVPQSSRLHLSVTAATSHPSTLRLVRE